MSEGAESAGRKQGSCAKRDATHDDAHSNRTPAPNCSRLLASLSRSWRLGLPQPVPSKAKVRGSWLSWAPTGQSECMLLSSGKSKLRLSGKQYYALWHRRAIPWAARPHASIWPQKRADHGWC